jgi:hypothetical protein
MVQSLKLKIMSRKIGLSVFLIVNLALGGYFLNQILYDIYVDGLMHLLPLVIADIVFMFAIVLLHSAVGFNKLFWSVFLIAFLHNLNFFVMEFTKEGGLVLVVASIIVVVFAFKR